MPLISKDNTGPDTKCLSLKEKTSSSISTDACDVNELSQIWELKDAANNNFLLVHKSSGRCAKPATRKVKSVVEAEMNCDDKNKDMLWTRLF